MIHFAASSGYFTVDQAIFWSPPSSFSCVLICHFARRVYTKSFRGLSQFDINRFQPQLGTSMQILRQTVDLVSLYTLPLDPHRAPLRLTRPRRTLPHGRVVFVVLFFVDFLGRYSCRQRPRGAPPGARKAHPDGPRRRKMHARFSCARARSHARRRQLGERTLRRCLQALLGGCGERYIHGEAVSANERSSVMASLFRVIRGGGRQTRPPWPLQSSP